MTALNQSARRERKINCGLRHQMARFVADLSLTLTQRVPGFESWGTHQVKQSVVAVRTFLRWVFRRDRKQIGSTAGPFCPAKTVQPPRLPREASGRKPYRESCRTGALR